MAERRVLVASPFLFAQRQAWGSDYEIIAAPQLGGALPSGAAAAVEVLVSDGEALDPKLVESLPQLKLVACFSTGYGGIDVDQLRRRGITLTTAAGINAHDVADHAIALLLSWWHGIPAGDRAVRAGQWRQTLRPRRSLHGRRMGIVGLGRIGLKIANRAQALGLTVQWWGPHPKPEAVFARAASLLELARQSEILVIATRASAANRGLIDADVLDALGPEGVLVNVSRGFLVDEPALLEALRAGRIAGAALDVFGVEPPDPKLWEALPQVVLSPHIAGFTQEAGIAMFGQLRENLRRFFAHEPLLTPLLVPP